jgi:hypothetical protein
MRTLHWKLVAVAAFALLGAGCVGGPPVGEDGQAIQLSSLPPDLPGCLSVKTTSRVLVRRIDGVRDLYVAYVNGSPVCVDSSEDINTEFSSDGVSYDGDSNPMPGIWQASSNPMPGNPQPSASVMSNPMPGQASYGQQGYSHH